MEGEDECGGVSETDFVESAVDDQVPDAATICRLMQQKVAIQDSRNGYTLDRDWSFEDVVSFLRKHFPVLFGYFDEGFHSDDIPLSPFLIMSRYYNILTVVPGIDKPTGNDLYDFSQKNKTNFQKHQLFFGTFLKLSCLDSTNH